MTSYLHSIVIMGLSRTVSEINGDSVETVYLTPLLKGLPLKLGIGARGQKTRMIGYQMVQKSFKIGLAV